MRLPLVSALAAGAVLLPTVPAIASHGGERAVGPPHDFAVGAAKNTFPGTEGPVQVALSARDRGGDPRGYVRSRGDSDGDLPADDGFTLQGEVTCVRVEGDRASIKYRFERATGSLEQFEGGGIQIFVEDNGEPGRGVPDANAFDPPQPEGVFQTNERVCDDPSTRFTYDPIESGNLTVHDAGG